MRQHASASVSIRQHTSAYIDACERLRDLRLEECLEAYKRRAPRVPPSPPTPPESVTPLILLMRAHELAEVLLKERRRPN
jgi:hypothetical protein